MDAKQPAVSPVNSPVAQGIGIFVVVLGLVLVVLGIWALGGAVLAAWSLFQEPSTATHSLTLWMVALMGPSSSTWAPVGAMKRPSEVPPTVDGVVRPPVTRLDGVAAGVQQLGPGRQEGFPGQRQSSSVVPGCHARRGWPGPLLMASGVCSVEKRRLKRAGQRVRDDVVGAGAGLRLEICRLVGGKCSLPSSHSSAASAASRGHGGSGCRPGAGRRHALLALAREPPLRLPRRPFLTMSPSRSLLEGSPTRA
jgi:hypothetical protein